MATTKQMEKTVAEVSKVFQFAFGEKNKSASLHLHINGGSKEFALQLPCPDECKGTHDCEGLEFRGGQFLSSNFDEIEAFSDWMKKIEFVRTHVVKFSKPGRPPKDKSLVEMSQAFSAPDVKVEEPKPAPVKQKKIKKEKTNP